MRGTWRLSSAKLLTRDEVGRILSSAKKSDARDYAVFATAANAGFRVSEVLHLRAQDVGEKTLMVARRKRASLKHEEHPAAPALCKLLRDRGAKSKKGEWLFPGGAGPCTVRGREICGGGHVSVREIERRWTAHLESLELWQEGRGIHTLRHYAGTEFYSEHRDLVATRDFLGHSTAAVTETYAHAVEMREKVDRIRPVL